jgi:hypothetical protein
MAVPVEAISAPTQWAGRRPAALADDDTGESVTCL